MRVTTKAKGAALAQHFGHAACLLCGQENPWSAGLAFEPDGSGGVWTAIKPDARLQGYDGMLHGGVASAFLDAAMTHCLFHRNIRAVTAELRVRYPHPVPVGSRLILRAWVTEERPPLFRLRGELADGTQVRVWAQATFCQMRENGPTPTIGLSHLERCGTLEAKGEDA